jgi:hypothetical protein
MVLTHFYSNIFLIVYGVGIFIPAIGRGIDSRNRVWNRVAKLHRLASRYDNPMPTWFLAPIAGLKLPTLNGKNLAGCLLADTLYI